MKLPPLNSLKAFEASAYRDSASALHQISALTAKLLGDRDHRPLCVSVLPALAERWLAPRLANWPTALRIRVDDDPVELAREGIDVRVTYGDHFYPAHHAVTLAGTTGFAQRA